MGWTIVLERWCGLGKVVQMNNLNERRLSIRYGTLLNLGGDSIHFGFECHDGWADLLEGTFRFVQSYAGQTGLEVGIVQVKEKFGELRIYQRGGDATVDMALDITELVSGFVCEICGSEGENTERHGWFRARCPEHSGVAILDVIDPRCSDEQYIVKYAATLGLVMYLFSENAARWIQLKSTALGGISPCEAMATTAGCESVYKLLKQLEHGVGV